MYLEYKTCQSIENRPPAIYIPSNAFLLLWS